MYCGDTVCVPEKFVHEYGPQVDVVALAARRSGIHFMESPRARGAGVNG
jgi:hypothetical protein